MSTIRGIHYGPTFAELRATYHERLAESQKPDAKAEFRFDGGNGAILCAICYSIIQRGHQIDWDSLRAGTLGPQFCSKHQHLKQP
jgi:hypothetical protein